MRRRKTLDLLATYANRWQGSYQLPGSNKCHEILRQVADTLKGALPQAQLIATQSHSPGALWAVACALSWRFGMNVHMVTLGRKGAAAPVPDEKLMESSLPLTILCEQVRYLSDPFHAEQLEAMINIAYQTNSFLWLEVVTQRPAIKGVSGKETSQARRAREKVNLYRQKPLIDFLAEHLSREAISQLRSLSKLPRVTFKQL